IERRKEIGHDGLAEAGASLQCHLLPEPAHAPFERDGDRIRLRLHDLGHLAAQQILLAVTSELEDALARRENPALLVADNEAGVRPRVVILCQLQEKAETATPASP